MAQKMPAADLPAGVDVARFARRTLRVGFVGGQEKEIKYDSRVEKDEGQIHYRRFIEKDGGSPLDGQNLESGTRKRTVLRVMSEQDVSYTEFVESQELFLVTWDHGESIQIMNEEEMMNVIQAVLESEERLRPENIPSEMPEIFGEEEEEPPAPAVGEKNEAEEIELESEEDNEPPEPVQKVQ